MHSQLIIYQGAKSSQRDREVFQTDGARTTGKMYGIKWNLEYLAAHVLIGMIQRRIAWPLYKDNKRICEVVHIFQKVIWSAFTIQKRVTMWSDGYGN